ncbi:DUF4328 domain-containing protein [Streptomyces sp. NPDC005963]|uniref:DUF4328 domain-containing protein n=1 Tax=Streptomyces sp. NPDC005963 TaxID=3156721 RepID=UPI0033DFDE47
MLMAVGGMLAVVALTDLYAIYRGWQVHSLTPTVEGITFTAQERLDDAQRTYNFAGTIQFNAYVGCGIAFIVWFHRMRRNAAVFAPNAFRQGPGWAIGSWFIPGVNLVLPYLIARTVWSAVSRPAADGKTVSWPLHVWWGLYVVSLLSLGLTGQIYGAADTFAGQRTGLLLLMAADVLDIVAAGMAAYFVIRLTDAMDSTAAAARPA